MSVCAVKKYENKIVLCADSIMVSGLNKDVTTKIFKINDSFGFAMSGLGRDAQLFYSFTKTNMIATKNDIDDIYDYLIKYSDYVKEKTGVWTCESSFLIVNNGKVFSSLKNVEVFEIDDFYAIGAGQDFALAAMKLGHTVEVSINVACDLSHYCSVPIITFEFNLS